LRTKSVIIIFYRKKVLVTCW